MRMRLVIVIGVVAAVAAAGVVGVRLVDQSSELDSARAALAAQQRDLADLRTETANDEAILRKLNADTAALSVTKPAPADAVTSLASQVTRLQDEVDSLPTSRTNQRLSSIELALSTLQRNLSNLADCVSSLRSGRTPFIVAC